MNGSYAGERGLVNRTLLLAVVTFALLGIVIIDGSSILFAKWQLSDVGDAAASDAAVAYSTSHSVQAARDEAARVIADRDSSAEIKKLTVDAQTSEVTLTLIKDASTLFVNRLGPLKDLAHLETTSTGRPPPA